MKVIILSELQNVAPRFKRAIWRKREVNRIFSSAKEAGKYYNLRNCNYEFENEAGGKRRRGVFRETLNIYDYDKV